MTVALYCRVSTDEQVRTSESILGQRQALERWARKTFMLPPMSCVYFTYTSK